LRRPAKILGVAFVVLLTLSPSAQGRVTLILKSGETLTGNLIELRDTTIRVGAPSEDGRERKVPLDDVSAIEFVPSSTPPVWNLLSSGQHVLILRNGTEVRGRLRSVEGTPLAIAIASDTGPPRVYRVADAARLLLAPPRTVAAADPNCAVPFVGQWTVNNSELGNLGFESSGGCQLSGWYDAAGGGTLRGTVNGQTVKFRWRASNGSQQGEAIGTLRHAKQFTGKFCVNVGCDTASGTEFNAIRQKVAL
jgi:small nuclear ribonucleoprotein (snRNP)-like protein